LALCLLACDESKNSPADSTPAEKDAHVDVFGSGDVGGADTQAAVDQTADASVDPKALPLFTLADLVYEGAFRVPSGKIGVSTTEYTDGQIEFNPARNSFFMIGHDWDDGAIGEFTVPQLVKGTTLSSLNEAKNLQPFAKSPLSRVSNPQNNNRITGLRLINGKLVINAVDWYDAAADNTHSTLVLHDPDNLDTSKVTGFYDLAGGPGHASGWISPIPAVWRAVLGGTYVVASGGAMSIAGRTTIGPAMFVFNPELDLVGTSPGFQVKNPIPTIKYLDYSVTNKLHSDWNNDTGKNKIWTQVTGALYGLIVPGTRTYLAIGHSGGHESGVQYKGTDLCGQGCGGPCPKDCKDKYLFYWAYDLNDLLKVKAGQLEPYEPQPYEYDKWPSPFGSTELGGGSFDPASGKLYVEHKYADDSRPVILVYTFKPKTS
jgi:hypothetical protein